MTRRVTSHELRTTDPRAFGRVAVMYGGGSSEREVSLRTGAAVLDALRARGVDAEAWDPAARGLAEFAAAGFDRVWNALHGPGGEDGVMQGALQALCIPYTGSGVMASALAMDKVRSKKLFAAAGLPTPAYAVAANLAEARTAAEALGYPLVMKPARQGSSIGMSKVLEPSELDRAVRHALQYDDVAVVEQCVVGDEITVAILQGTALPSVRIETPRTFYDYRAKYEASDTRYHCPGTEHDETEARYAELALRAFGELGCEGWGRVDFMHALPGDPQILEVNTVPGMTSQSLVPRAARAAGIGFEELCWRVLETSLARDTVAAEIRIAGNES